VVDAAREELERREHKPMYESSNLQTCVSSSPPVSLSHCKSETATDPANLQIQNQPPADHRHQQKNSAVNFCSLPPHFFVCPHHFFLLIFAPALTMRVRTRETLLLKTSRNEKKFCRFVILLNDSIIIVNLI